MPALDSHHSYHLLRRNSYTGAYVALIFAPLVIGIALIACIIRCCHCHYRDKDRERLKRLAEREAAVRRDAAVARALQEVELRGGEGADDEAIARTLAEGEVAPAYAPAVEGGEERAGEGERIGAGTEGDAPPPYIEGPGARA